MLYVVKYAIIANHAKKRKKSFSIKIWQILILVLTLNAVTHLRADHCLYDFVFK